MTEGYFVEFVVACEMLLAYFHSVTEDKKQSGDRNDTFTHACGSKVLIQKHTIVPGVSIILDHRDACTK